MAMEVDGWVIEVTCRIEYQVIGATNLEAA
jgi:hypothetical protein